MTYSISKKPLLNFALKGAVAILGMTLLGSSGVLARDATVPKDGTIAYVLTDLHWGIYESADGKTECPDGFNEGNREQFKALFPQDGQTRTLLDTQLRREIDG